MRITTRAVYQMTDDGFVELERESFDYDGPVAQAKGGGDQTTVSEPWAEAQPYILEGLRGASRAFRNPPDFYPGQTFVGPTPGQIAGFDTRLNYMDQVFGGQQAPRFGEATGALSGALTGATNLGGMASSLAPFSANALRANFTGAPSFNPGAFTPDVNFDPSSFAPDLMTAGGLDTSQAFRSALSGAPDYAGLTGAIEAANAPIMRQFEQDILPGLEQRASFLGNPTGGIKTLNRVLPEIGERMALNAQTLTNQERLRALGAQQDASRFLTQAGLQGYGLGGSLAGQAAGIDLRELGLGLQGAGQQAGILGDYRSQLLGLGGLGGQLAGQETGQALQGAALFPNLAQTGEAPGILAQQYADFGAGFQQRALQDQINRYNFYQNQPLDLASWYANLAYGGGGMGGTTTAQGPEGNRFAGAMGGALAGAQLGSVIPGIGTVIGAGIGGLGGLLFA